MKNESWLGDCERKRFALTIVSLLFSTAAIAGDVRNASKSLAGAHLREAHFSHDGKSLLALGDSLDLWDLESGKAVRRFGSFDVATISPDNKRVVTGLEVPAPNHGIPGLLGVTICTVSVFNTADAKELWHEGISGGALYSAMFSCDGKRILTVSAAGCGLVLEAETGKKLLSFEARHGALHDIRTNGLPDFLYPASFSPDGRQLLTIQRHDDGERLVTRDATTGREIKAFGTNWRSIESAVFSGGGRVVLTAAFDHTAQVWDARTGKQIRVFRGHQDVVSSAVFSPDGRTVLTASLDGTARLWNAVNGAVIITLKCGAEHLDYAAFNADGSRILVRWQGYEPGSPRHEYFPLYAALFDPSNGREIKRLSLGPDGVAVVSRDGKRLFTTIDNGVPTLWSTGTGEAIREYK